MKRVLWSLVVGVGLATAALAFAGVASAEHAVPSEAVPFDASCSGTATPPVNGHVTSVAFCLTNLIGGSTEVTTIALTPGPGPLCQTNLGSAVLTGANGEQIFLAASGTSCFNPFTGLVDLSGTQTITGGTGRFKEARGALTVAGTVNPATNAISYTLDGTIFLLPGKD